MNQFLPIHSVKGSVGVGNRLQSHSSNGSESTAIKENHSDAAFVPSFSNVLRQFEGTNSEPKEQVVIEAIEHKEPEINFEEALVPFLHADAEELAEHLDPGMVTSMIIHAIAQEDQDQTNQKALALGVTGAEALPADHMMRNGSIKSEEKQAHVRESGQPSLFRMPISVLKSYPFQEQQTTQLVQDQEVPEQLDRLLGTLKANVNLPKQILAEDTELFQQVASKVETFFHSKDQTTLNQLITEIKDTVRPTVRKPVDMHIEGATNDLESSDELEKLLLHLKADKSAAKVMEDTPRPSVVESRVDKNETLIPNQALTSRSFNERVIKEASEMELKTTGHTVLPEEGSKLTDRTMATTANDMKSSALNESLLAPEKTVLASERVLQQAETLKAEGQTDERRFVKTLQRILQQGSMTQRSDGQTTITLKLFPEHLGKLQIQVIQSGQKLAAQIIAESSATKELVERSLPQLRQALSAQSVAFDQIDVEEFVNRDQQQHEQEQSDQPDQQKDENESRTETSFSFKSLLEGLFS